MHVGRCTWQEVAACEFQAPQAWKCLRQHCCIFRPHLECVQGQASQRRLQWSKRGQPRPAVGAPKCPKYTKNASKCHDLWQVQHFAPLCTNMHQYATTCSRCGNAHQDALRCHNLWQVHQNGRAAWRRWFGGLGGLCSAASSMSRIMLTHGLPYFAGSVQIQMG